MSKELSVVLAEQRMLQPAHKPLNSQSSWRLPHGPLDASSNISNSLSLWNLLRPKSENRIHLAWLMTEATGTIKAARQMVASMAIRPLSVRDELDHVF